MAYVNVSRSIPIETEPGQASFVTLVAVGIALGLIEGVMEGTALVETEGGVELVGTGLLGTREGAELFAEGAVVEGAALSVEDGGVSKGGALLLEGCIDVGGVEGPLYGVGALVGGSV